jgi:branched-chain amino acid transport system permease protein
MLIAGGSGNNKGAILGAYIVWGFWSVTGQIRAYLDDWGIEFLTIRIFYLRDLVIGALIVIILLLRPAGLLPEERRVSLFVGKEAERPRPSDETKKLPEYAPSGADPSAEAEGSGG